MISKPLDRPYPRNQRTFARSAARLRHTTHCGILVVVALLSLGACGDRSDADGPNTLFLTWDHDPTTTMVVQWLEDVDETETPTVSVRPVEGGTWNSQIGQLIPFGTSPLRVCRVELKGLEPGRTYLFRVGDYSRHHRFRTMPESSDEPITFVSGGDVASNDLTDVDVHIQAARCNPQFVLIGGDLAYGDGIKHEQWVKFLEVWNQHMVTADGRMIPLVACIGNHEVRQGYGRSRAAAPYFYSLFRIYPEHGFAALDFGNYMSIILLDSTHTTPVEGEQTRWLDQALSDRRDVTDVFVAYHVSAFPAHNGWESRLSRSIRANWVPLFEKYGVSTVFEHHGHVYKRTHPIRNNQVDATGVLYMGDGGWGSSRTVKTPDAWYLACSHSSRNYIQIIIAAGRITHVTMNAVGDVIDMVTVTKSRTPTVIGNSGGRDWLKPGARS